MTRNKLVISFVLLFSCAALVWAAGSRRIHVVKTATFSVKSVSDTMTVTPAFGVDSFLYIDTFQMLGTGTKIGVTWTSPAWKQRLWVDTATNNFNYICSLYVNGTKRVVSFTSAASGMTAATVADSFRLVINRITGLKDSVIAEDSGSYCLLRSVYPQISYVGDARWYGARGTTAARQYKFHFDTVFANTVAQVCDSMVAKINATTTIKDTVRAITGTTAYKIVSLTTPPTALLVYQGASSTDTTQDTTRSTVWSTKYDTIPLASLAQDEWVCNSHRADIYFSALADTLRGLGKLDSVYIMLKSSWDSCGTRVYLTLDSDKVAIPGGLHSKKIYAAANDTLYRDALYLIYYMKDSTSDTSYTTTGTIKVDALLKEE